MRERCVCEGEVYLCGDGEGEVYLCGYGEGEGEVYLCGYGEGERERCICVVKMVAFCVEGKKNSESECLHIAYI